MPKLARLFERLRPKPHWTPRYVLDRTHLSVWQRLNQGAPWLVAESVEFLHEWLASTDLVVEFGAGRSTLWFGARVGEVISIETDPEWHRIVVARAAKKGLQNVHCLLETSEHPDAFLAAADEAVRNRGSRPSLVVVDGRFRAQCTTWALSTVGANGLVVLDNAERYVPSASRVPGALPIGAEPPEKSWRQAWDEIEKRRSVRMSNGVWDTLLIFGVPMV